MRYLLLLLIPLLAQSQTSDLRFADFLIRQGDYFRAITEYKRGAFSTTDDSVKDHCFLQIAKAYRRSGKFDLAVEYAAAVLMRSAASPATRYAANVSLGMCYVESDMPGLALPYLEAANLNPDRSAFVLLCIGVASAQSRDCEGALRSFKEAEGRSALGGLRTAAAELSRRVAEYAARPKLSSTFAAALSFVVPGAGQLYSSHTYDALQAFLYTSSMAFAAFAVYRYEHSVTGHLAWTYVGISVAAMFHLANIIGAARTAEYRNWKAQTDMARDLKDVLVRCEP
jgi:TM2 domain-containing membrane protein YozV